MTDGEYAAARESAVYFRRGDRLHRRVDGKSPTRMLNGLLSGSMPPDLAGPSAGGLRCRAPWSAVLSPKGKMISEVRLLRLANGEAGALLLDLPVVGATEALSHLARYLPPRLAKLRELDGPTGTVSVVGPQAPEFLATTDWPLEADLLDLRTLVEGDEIVSLDTTQIGLRVVRAARALPFSFDVLASASALARFEQGLIQRGVRRGSDDLDQILRIERGRPAFGPDMDNETIPFEVGAEGRYIDHGKGCYTGQEVIVRLRDRGHVNRVLRGVFLDEAGLPSAGAPLFAPGNERPIGEIRSAAFSPGFGKGVALAFVRGEIEPPATLTIGAADGPPGSIRELTPDGWRLVPGDPSLHA